MARLRAEVDALTPDRKAQLAARRKLLTGRVRDAKRPKPPTALAERYAGALRAVNRVLVAEVKKALVPWLKEVKGERNDAAINFRALLIRLNRIAADMGARTSENFAEAIARGNLAEMSAILKIDLAAEPARVLRLLESWRAENVDLITSIAKRLHSDVRRIVAEVTRTGERVESVSRRLAERYAVSESRANLIARDQVLKANSDLTRVRATEAGITRYRWSTSKDERVRGKPGGKNPNGLHFALEGQIFAWNDPPIAGLDGSRAHPGQDYQCRCIAIPVLGGELE